MPRLLIVLCFVCSLGCGDDAEDSAAFPDGEAALREVVLEEAPLETGEDPLVPVDAAEHRVVVERLREARTSPLARGIFLRVGPLGGAFGRMADLRDELRQIRAAQKPVHCHFESADNASYALLAASCDRLTMSPAGSLELLGVALEVVYARTLLENAGLRAELFQVGRFKGAADPFTLDSMPAEVRENLTALLDALDREVVASIATGRKLAEARVRELFDQGPFDARDARAAGLIDDVEFDDEAREHARRAAKADATHPLPLVPAPAAVGLADLLAALSGEQENAEMEGPRIALVHLTGEIVDAESGHEGRRSGPFVAALRRLTVNDEVKAIVLRIDSPGGSALASDRMWHAVHRAAQRKPVIVSIGDMAASGGYYIAAAGTEIFAQPTSIVGSIGVVGGKFVADALAARVGVRSELLARGARAGLSSPMRGFDEGEKRALMVLLERTYERFVGRVATGRRLERAQVERVAEGRLLAGEAARQARLIDTMGGLTAALDRARARAQLPADAPIEQWPGRRGLLDTLAQMVAGSSASTSTLATIERLVGPLGSHARALLSAPLALARDRVAAVMPFGLVLQ